MKLPLLLIGFVVIASVHELKGRLGKNGSGMKKRKTWASAVFTTNVSGSRNPNCKWLKGAKHQFQMCNKKKGLDAVLMQARDLAVQSCRENFRYKQWDCSNTSLYFQKNYRETALMTSISASALVYAIARACATGQLRLCKCAAHGKSPNETEWQWGGCGDNIKFARKFTRSFLQLKKKKDEGVNLEKHNSRIGIDVVVGKEEKHCKCHGISGSCSMKICWKRLRPFSEISQVLRDEYHSATVPPNSTALQKKYRKLLYVDIGPDLCPLTSGRRCSDIPNCVTLCCVRGYYTKQVPKMYVCNCKMFSNLYPSCENCTTQETVYICK